MERRGGGSLPGRAELGGSSCLSGPSASGTNRLQEQGARLRWTTQGVGVGKPQGQEGSLEHQIPNYGVVVLRMDTPRDAEGADLKAKVVFPQGGARAPPRGRPGDAMGERDFSGDRD